MMSDDFELGEDEMEPTSSVTFQSNYICEARIAEQNKASISVYKAFLFFYYRSKDKTIIHSLVSFIAL